MVEDEVLAALIAGEGVVTGTASALASALVWGEVDSAAAVASFSMVAARAPPEAAPSHACTSLPTSRPAVSRKGRAFSMQDITARQGPCTRRPPRLTVSARKRGAHIHLRRVHIHIRKRKSGRRYHRSRSYSMTATGINYKYYGFHASVEFLLKPLTARISATNPTWHTFSCGTRNVFFCDL